MQSLLSFTDRQWHQLNPFSTYSLLLLAQLFLIQSAQTRTHSSEVAVSRSSAAPAPDKLVAYSVAYPSSVGLGQQEKVLKTALCEQAELNCQYSKTSLYVSMRNNLVYVIDNSKPQMTVFAPSGNQYILKYRLNGQNLAIVRATVFKKEEFYILPVIFPAYGESQNPTIAIISSGADIFTGGGQGKAKADFIPLPQATSFKTSQTQVKIRPIYRNVPFRCFEIISVCHSAQDYKASRHCHAESDGNLLISSYGTAMTPEWTFNWYHTSWPAHVARSKMSGTLTPLALTKLADGTHGYFTPIKGCRA